MASQTITLSRFYSNLGGAFISTPNATIDAGLTADGSAVLSEVRIHRFSATSTLFQLDLTGGDLSDAWETGGSVTLFRGTTAFTFEARTDRDEPYRYTLTNDDLWQTISTNLRDWSITLDDGAVAAIRNVHVGDKQIERIYVGSTEIVRAYIGDTQVFGEVPNVHRYTITCGEGSSRVGFSDGQFGSITNGRVALPSGENTDILMTATGGSVGNELRFIVGGRSNRGIEQFPPTITTERAGTSIIWARGTNTQNYTIGVGVDYTTINTGQITTVFQDGVTVNVSLDYP